MNLRRLRLPALLLPLLVAACNVGLVSFVVPTQVQSGAMFEIRVDAFVSGISGDSGEAGCVLQIPVGFAVRSANYFIVVSGQSAPTGPDPGLAGIYTAEPGYYLAGFWGGGYNGYSYNSVGLQVFLEAPAAQIGTYTFKVALTGGSHNSWVAQDPPQTNFAAITAAQYVKTLTLVSQPLGDFAYDSSALPAAAIPHWFGVAAADVDGDGFDDLAAAGSFNSQPYGPRCWLSRPRTVPTVGGTGWTERSGGLAFSSNWDRIAFADIDRDGFVDIVSGNGLVFFGNGATSWSAIQLPLSFSSQYSSGIAIGDVNRDGLPDIAVSGRLLRTVQVLLNNGNRTFRDASLGLPYGSLGGGDGLLLIDLDGDGFLDLFSSGPAPNVGLGNGGQSWTLATAPTTSHGTGSSAIALDIDGDGRVEVLSGGDDGSASGSGISIVHHVSGTTFASLSVTGLPTTGVYLSIAALDFDRDGLMDLALGRGRSINNGGIELYRNLGGGAFAPQSSSGLTDVFYGYVDDLVVGDFNGDTWPDLAAAVDGAGVFVFQNTRTGVAPFGQGCAGVGIAEPQLTALGAPQRGNSAFAMQLHSSVPSVFGAFWFDFQRQLAPPYTLPIDLLAIGAPSCTLYTNPQFLFVGLSDTAGDATFALPVPQIPSLAHVTAFGQGAVFLPSANAFGAVVTSASAIRID
jgi:hypothetical protein